MTVKKSFGKNPDNFYLNVQLPWARRRTPKECRFNSPQREGAVFGKACELGRESVASFINDGALSRGAAIAFYAVTSIGPLLLIAVAIAGLAFGQDAARGAIASQLSGLMGQQSAELLQNVIRSASGKSSGIFASALGVVTLLLTASGMFGEIQSALNVIWGADPKGSTVYRLLRARAASLGLVVALGFLLLVSLVISAGLSVLSAYVNAYRPVGHFILQAVNFVISFALISVLFAAIYKVLPDKDLEWRDVLVGAVVTALLFSIGKFLIGLYIGSSAVASSYGAAGALIVALLWIYYSAQIFLLGAEFTKVYARHHGSQQLVPQAADMNDRQAPL
jgi:membrane protein